MGTFIGNLIAFCVVAAMTFGAIGVACKSVQFAIGAVKSF